MAIIKVEELNNDVRGYEFQVKVSEGDSETEHNVRLTRLYYDQLTRNKISPESLVEKSFEFLLAHESKEAIFKEFDLSVIAKYFPVYENDITELIK